MTAPPSVPEPVCLATLISGVFSREDMVNGPLQGVCVLMMPLFGLSSEDRLLKELAEIGSYAMC